MKEVKNQNLWIFEIGSQKNMILSIWNIVGFQQRDKQDSQKLNNDTFCRLAYVSAQAMIGTKKQPDAAILLYYKDHVFSQGYAQIKEAFRNLTKDDLL